MTNEREALLKIVAIKNKMYGDDWQEIEEARAIARAALSQPSPAVPVASVHFEGYLCRASGETDLPCAEVVPDLAGVRRFIVREWLNDEKASDLQDIMDEIENHNYKDEGPWTVGFEIGGASVEPVYSYTAPQPTEPAQPATQAGAEERKKSVCETCGGNGVEGDADYRGELICTPCSECNGSGRAVYPLSDDEVISRAEVAGFRYLKPDDGAHGFPGGFDLEHGLTAMRRLLSAAPTAEQPGDTK